MTPKLSIIIPVYQAENYLQRCLDSVLKQTMQDFELILINDGSTDSSGKICDAYALHDNRINVIHKTNQGQSSARNDGIERARGEYVGFVDNDDVVYPDMFELLIHNIEEADADISACSFIQDNGDGTTDSKNHTLKKLILTNKEGVKEFLSRENLDIYVWTKIYKKAFIDRHNIKFEIGKTDEDFLFNFEAFKHAKRTVIEDIPKYIYYHREDSACRLFPQKHLKAYLNMTLYRVDKILSETKEMYPDYAYLANRQKLKYCFIMLKTIIQTGESNVESEYRQILDFLKENIRQLYADRKLIGCTAIGIFMVTVLPSGLYYRYRRFKDSFVG